MFAVVDNCQAEHKGIVIETTREIGGISFSILFDSGASDSFISPSLVERCGLAVAKQVDR